MKRSTIKTITVASGANWQVTFRRNGGYSATVNTNFIGTFATLTEALAAVTEQRLNNAAVGVAA